MPRRRQLLAIDCEMVGTGPRGRFPMLARVSIVNRNEECIYNEFVYPDEKVTDYRTWVSGIRKRDLMNGLDFAEVREDVRDIIHKNILIGHCIHYDLRSLQLSHPQWNIRDTAIYFSTAKNRTPALRDLAWDILGEEIQVGEHNSIEDALSTMRIYKAVAREWEYDIGN